MGHSMFSVSVVSFIKGKLIVLCEKADKVGGRDMDECLMREFAAQFEKKHGMNPLGNKKAMIKLEDSVGKTKKILSSNSEAGISVECLMEDYDFAGNMTRDDFQKMCQPMMDRVKAVLESAKAACGLSMDEIGFVEIVGGASRVPWVKEMISEAFGGKELSTTMNADECVARGCALQAAILSPLYKVRDFTVEDTAAHAVQISWVGSSPEDGAKEDDGDEKMAATADGDKSSAVVFPENSTLNVTKMLTFWRKTPFELKASYKDEKALMPSVSPNLGKFMVELSPQEKAAKVKVRVKLTLHGTFAVEGAQLVEDEEYEETVKEKRELPPDPEAETKEGEEKAEEKKDGAEGENGDKKGDEPMPDAQEEAPKKKEEKKYEWVDVVKKKKRTKKTDIRITSSDLPGLTPEKIQVLKDCETAMIAEQREIVETDEKRNDLETYIFDMRSKLESAYGEFVSASAKEKFQTELTNTENWLYDTDGATKLQYVDKLAALKETGEPIAWRCKEAGLRSEWIAALQGTIANYRAACENPGEKYGHIASEKLVKITAACLELEKWLEDMKAKQEKTPKYEKPILLCADMEKKNKEIATMANGILSEKKPEPPKAEKKPEPAPAPKAEPTSPPKEEKKEGKDNAPAPSTSKDEGPPNMDIDD
eukprot:gnl/TRDRNA2_/TRDRNA2_170883_c0_seq4.p1 gnl/TRDRNA2_/TRDRNA2_170883_c0~~gnl/TRDRNA2_/TRDRNA2_170883_c0_seq4.p1  ORF type:complete len:652 (-),score=225.92 gnl/TRDRNA2_/TRDRNA2_170883_c0_seq4:86-2041(-)